MSQGILERVETKLDLLIELISKGGALPTATAETIGEASTVLQQPTSLAEKAATGSEDPYAGVDKDGVPWDARIHSKAKEPISATTGKWKRKKGITDILYTDVTAELQAAAYEEANCDIAGYQDDHGPYFWQDTATGVSNTVETRAEMDELLKIPTTQELTEAEFDALILEETPPSAPKAPAAPLAPKAPAAPLAPKSPAAPLAPKSPAAPLAPKSPAAPLAPKSPAAPGTSTVNPVKTQVLNMIKNLTDTHKAEPNDINQLMVEKTGFDTIGKVTDENLDDFLASLMGWHKSVRECGEMYDAMKVIADANGLTTDLDAGIDGVLEPHAADCFGLVHYSAIAGVRDQLAAYLVTWQEL